MVVGTRLNLTYRNTSNLFSRLSSPTINIVGAFLTKIESIHLGYLNKQIYIETQKKSYLLNRTNDKPFVLTDELINRFYWKSTNPFNYSMPNQLTIDAPKYSYIDTHDDDDDHSGSDISEKKSIAKLKFSRKRFFSSKWFERMFNRLTNFTCYAMDCLPFIPISLLISTETKHNCDRVITVDFSKITKNNTENLTNNLLQLRRNSMNHAKYLSNRNKNPNSSRYNITVIDTLQINGYFNWNDIGYRPIGCYNKMMDELEPIGIHGASNIVISLGVFSRKISLSMTKIYFEEKQLSALLCMFGIQELSIDWGCTIIINNRKSEDKVHVHKVDDHDDDNHKKVSKKLPESTLKCISLNFGKYRSTEDSHLQSLEFLKQLDILELTKNVEYYRVCLSLYCDENDSRELKDIRQGKILHDLMIKHYDAQPLLNKIIIEQVLSYAALANVFLFLIERKEQIFDVLTCTCRINVIQFIFDANSRRTDYFKRENKIFDSALKEQDYNIHDQEIEITLSKFNRQEMGVVYQNLIDWFQRVECYEKENQMQVEDKVVTIKIERS